MTPYDEIDQILTQAEALLQDDKPVEALSLLDRARKLEPKHAWTMLFRGVALGQLGRIDEAVEQLISAADLSVEDIDIQVDAARHLSLFEFYQDAIICAERAIVLDANDAGAQAIHGEVLERLGRIAEALPSRETALALDPSDVDTRYYLAVDYCDLGRFTEAYATAQPLFEEFADDPDIIRLQGACLSYLGRHQEALTCWAELERIEGITPNLLHNRASTLDALGLQDEALATIDQAIDLEPDLAMNYYTRGMVHERAGDDMAAIEDYLAALTRDPEHLDAVVNLVELASTTDVVPVALERIEHLLSFTPGSAKLLYGQGRLLMELGQLAEGIEAIKAAMQREPSLGIGWYTLTMLFGMTGDYEEAVSAADRALRYFPDDPGLWLNRGLALHDLKQYPEAMTCYDQAINLAPDDILPWLQLGRLLLLELERPADARGALKEVLRLQPDNHSAMWMLGLCYLRLGQLEEATTLLQALLQDDVDYLWGRLVRAALYSQQGNLDAAFCDLAIATEQGYNARLLLNEPLFEPLWADPRFDDIVRSASRQGTRRRTPKGLTLPLE